MGCLNLQLTNEHILNCPKLNKNNHEYLKILNGSLKEKVNTLRIYEENWDIRTKHLQDSVSSTVNPL